jgi:hypothetical protein
MTQGYHGCSFRASAGQALDETDRDRFTYEGKDDRQCCTRPLRGESSGRVHGKDDVKRQARQLGRERIEGGLPGSRPSVLDRDILCFDPPVIS